MQPVTLEDRKKELRALLHQLQTRPSHDWTEAEQRRVVVLKEMIASMAGKAAAPGPAVTPESHAGRHPE